MADGTGNFSTGRLVVHVTDQNGRPLDRANVDVTGEDSSFYRNTGVTSQDGRVSFSGVPQVVNVSVTHQGGSYSQNFLVPPTGVSEMRLIVQTFDTGEDPQQQQDSGDQGGAGGGGFGGFRR